MKRLRRKPRALVGGLAITLAVVFLAPVASAHNQSGDHPGCITASSGHWKQAENGVVTYKIEPGTGSNSQSAWEAAGTSAWINIPGSWTGGWWSITGIHPTSGTAYMHCH